MEFEVDLSAPLPGGGGKRRGEESSDEEEEVDRDTLLQQLNMESLGVERGEESDSDQEVGHLLQPGWMW